jgi:hypothetical protein
LGIRAAWVALICEFFITLPALLDSFASTGNDLHYTSGSPEIQALLQKNQNRNWCASPIAYFTAYFAIFSSRTSREEKPFWEKNYSKY